MIKITRWGETRNLMEKLKNTISFLEKEVAPHSEIKSNNKKGPSNIMIDPFHMASDKDEWKVEEIWHLDSSTGILKVDHYIQIQVKERPDLESYILLKIW